MVGVGVEVSIGTGVAVGGVESNGRQAASTYVIARRAIFPTIAKHPVRKQSPNLRGDCFVAFAPRNDRENKVL